MTPHDIRNMLLARDELALIDLRDEATFASGHPLLPAQIPLHRLHVEAPWRLGIRSGRPIAP